MKINICTALAMATALLSEVVLAVDAGSKSSLRGGRELGIFEAPKINIPDIPGISVPTISTELLADLNSPYEHVGDGKCLDATSERSFAWLTFDECVTTCESYHEYAVRPVFAKTSYPSVLSKTLTLYLFSSSPWSASQPATRLTTPAK